MDLLPKHCTCWSSIAVDYLAMGDISAENSTQVGGLIGESYYSGTVLNVTDCYARSSVDCDAGVAGGFIGLLDVFGTGAAITVANCYSTGLVSSSAGGLIGEDESNGASITDCFWDIQTSGTDTLPFHTFIKSLIDHGLG